MDPLLETKLKDFRKFMQKADQQEHEQDARERSEEYQRLFSPLNIEDLQGSQMEQFLDWEGRWSGLFRQKGRILSDISRLKDALRILLDETRDIRERLDKLIPWGGHGYIKGLGRAVLTAILHLVYPDKYGVYNQTVEDGLARLGRMPKFEWGEKFGSRYDKVNRVLVQLSEETGLSLADLDHFLWFVIQPAGTGETTSETPDRLEIIERHLQQLLADNWEQTELAKEWGIYEEDEEPVGVEFQAGDSGRIDILCKKRRDDTWEDEWLVIELKRSTGGPGAIGQLLSYMGWVQENLVDGKEKGRVRGLLIVGERDPKLDYALRACGAPVGLKRYNIALSLETIDL